MNLGDLEFCLNVKDINTSLAFYEKLGYKQTDGKVEEGWAIVKNGETILGLYKGHIQENILNFRRGDNIFELAKELKAKGLKFKKDANNEDDGSIGASLLDPDGNEIYLNTHPDELK